MSRHARVSVNTFSRGGEAEAHEPPRAVAPAEARYHLGISALVTSVMHVGPSVQESGGMSRVIETLVDESTDGSLAVGTWRRGQSGRNAGRLLRAAFRVALARPD